jgi:hypothetical protein
MVRDHGHIIWFDRRVGRLVPVLRVHGFEGQGARDLGLLCLALPGLKPTHPTTVDVVGEGKQWRGGGGVRSKLPSAPSESSKCRPRDDVHNQFPVYAISLVVM